MHALIFIIALALGPAQSVDLGFGVVLQAYQAGDEANARQTVVLVPGLTGCAWGFRHLAADLTAAGCRVVVIEPLGVGDSARPADADYSLTAQSDRLAAAMTDLRTGPSVVVAHGVSASIVLRLAYRRPDLVLAVVSIEGGPDETSLTPTVEGTLGHVSLAAKLGANRLIRDRFRSSLEAASGDCTWINGVAVRRYFQGSGRDIPATVTALRAMAAAVEPESLQANLQRVRCPVLLLLGSAEHNGRPSEAAVALLRERLSDCRVLEIAGAGHYIFEEQPTAVADAVLAIVTEQTPATVAAAGGATCAQ